MYIVIDLMGDDAVTSVPPEETPEEIERKELMRQYALEKIFRRTPQPQVVPVEIDR